MTTFNLTILAGSMGWGTFAPELGDAVNLTPLVTELRFRFSRYGGSTDGTLTLAGPISGPPISRYEDLTIALHDPNAPEFIGRITEPPEYQGGDRWTANFQGYGIFWLEQIKPRGLYYNRTVGYIIDSLYDRYIYQTSSPAWHRIKKDTGTLGWPSMVLDQFILDERLSLPAVFTELAKITGYTWGVYPGGPGGLWEILYCKPASTAANDQTDFQIGVDVADPEIRQPLYANTVQVIGSRLSSGRLFSRIYRRIRDIPRYGMIEAPGPVVAPWVRTIGDGARVAAGYFARHAIDASHYVFEPIKVDPAETPKAHDGYIALRDAGGALLAREHYYSVDWSLAKGVGSVQPNDDGLQAAIAWGDDQDYSAVSRDEILSTIAHLALVPAGRDTTQDGLGSTVDSDGDGIPDASDLYPQSPSGGDLDEDHVHPADDAPRPDFAAGQEDEHWDTDGDGVPDDQEAIDGTDEDKADTDGDGLPDGIERVIGTDGTLPDTDYDGMSDFEEWWLGRDPLTPGPGDTVPPEVSPEAGLIERTVSAASAADILRAIAASDSLKDQLADLINAIADKLRIPLHLPTIVYDDLETKGAQGTLGDVFHHRTGTVLELILDLLTPTYDDKEEITNTGTLGDGLWFRSANKLDANLDLDTVVHDDKWSSSKQGTLEQIIRHRSATKLEVILDLAIPVFDDKDDPAKTGDLADLARFRGQELEGLIYLAQEIHDAKTPTKSSPLSKTFRFRSSDEVEVLLDVYIPFFDDKVLQGEETTLETYIGWDDETPRTKIT